MRSRKQIAIHIILLAIVVGATLFVTPKREFLIVPVLALLVGFSVYVRPLRLSRAPYFLVGAVVFSMATLFGRIFVPALQAGVTLSVLDDWDLFRTFVIRLMSSDTNFFDATIVCIYGRQDILGKFKNWWDAFYRPNFEPFLYAIPRFLWPSKPTNFVDIATALRAIGEGLPLDQTDGGNGVGLIGASWAYGTLAGLVCGMALLGWVAFFVDRFMAKTHYASAGRILVFAISATSLFQLYRQATIGWWFLAFFQTSAVFWLTTLMLTYLAERHSRLPPSLPLGSVVQLDVLRLEHP